MKKICFAIAAFCSALSVNISHADSEILRNDLTGHLYQRFDKSLSWESSKMDCQKRGGYLATVTSADENDFLSSNFIKDKNPGGIWLGGSNDRSGAWEWVTGEVWEFNNWNEGEPNNVGGTVKGGSEHYLVMGHFPGRGKWNDINSYNNGLLIFSEFYEVSRLCEWDSGSSYILIEDQ